MKNHGVNATIKIPGVRARAQETCVKRFGSKCPITNNEIAEKAKATLNERYGVDNPSKSEEIKTMKRNNCVAIHGVQHHMQLDEVKQKYDYEEISRKVHETKKKNGFYSNQQSKPENMCHDILCEMFGANDIQRHKSINDWDIDLYVTSLDLFIQVDGAYYHGLDRPIEEILKFKTRTDKTIYSTIKRDQKQNDWFEQNNKILIRFTDKEISLWQKQNNLQQQVKDRINQKLMR